MDKEKIEYGIQRILYYMGLGYIIVSVFVFSYFIYLIEQTISTSILLYFLVLCGVIGIVSEFLFGLMMKCGSIIKSKFLVDN